MPDFSKTYNNNGEMLIVTCDPYVFIEKVTTKQGGGFIWTYRNTAGKRWEANGKCTNIGNCWIGAVGDKPTLDCPVAVGFTGCCNIQTKWLADGAPIILK